MADKESTVLHFHPSWRGMFGWHLKWLAAVLLVWIISYFALPALDTAAIVLLSLLLLFGIGWLIRYNVSYIVTTQRIREGRGILSKHYESAFFEQITNTVVDQSLVERMLGVGSVAFDTAGERNVTSALAHRPGGEHFLAWWGVRHPRQIEDMIDDLRLKSEGH